MLVVVSDTHGRESHRLHGRTLEAVETADLVIHAGDFVTPAVFDAFDSVCDLRGVAGNNDPLYIRERVPDQRVVEWEGFRIGVVHGHGRSSIDMTMFGRQSQADLIVFGHSHKPEFRDLDLPALNPGSHANPRWFRPAHAELETDGSALVGRLVQPSGETLESFRIDPA